MSAYEPWLRTMLSASQGSRPSRDGERGASAVEYGLLIAGIAAIIAVVVFAFGDSIGDVLFEDTCQEMVAGRGDGDCV